MQDRTINNALLALRREGGDVQVLAEQLLTLRGIPLPIFRPHDRPLSRGACKRLALSLLPCTSTVVADAIQARLPGVSRKSACQRAYMALVRLEEAGRVVKDGWVWRRTEVARAGTQSLFGIYVIHTLLLITS